ncbi:hypothetical protein Tsubulata_028956 [Turnera subulata]|uniref:caffeate O-methyltransferase n=1 Tax=Turnera subulata TaxID=218843 RepID=A0A9Q0FQ69_9ROSI|nr:hypothetical protein Tsubulata_028956 [Turnera subulata]
MSTPPETFSQLANQENKNFSYAIQLALGSVLPMAMKTAFELGIFEIIAKAGAAARLSVMDIAAKLPTNNPDAPNMLDRILRLLVSHSVLACSHATDSQGIQTRLYSLLPVAEFFVADADGVSLGPLLTLLQDKVYLESWPALKDAVLDGGIAFDRVHGMHVYEYPKNDPGFGRNFNMAVMNHSTIVIRKLLESYKGFEQIKQLIDIGGGLGLTLNIITSKYPHIKGVNFDLPRVIEEAQSYPGVEHVAGDMFESVPEGEAMFMKWILHNWSDEYCLKLLKNCHKALAADGKLIVMDAVVPVMPDSSVADKEIAHMDVFMMAQDHGGKERTQQEFLTLATGAGFSSVKLVCNVCNFGVMEFYK